MQELLGVNWGKISNILVALLIISVFFETTLATIFSWSVWEKYIKGRGGKVPLAIGLALCVTWTFDLDMFSQLLDAIGYQRAPGPAGMILTALLIAGGSGGVNELLKRANIRRSANAWVRGDTKGG